jgi:hypothetical protein
MMMVAMDLPWPEYNQGLNALALPSALQPARGRPAGAQVRKGT